MTRLCALLLVLTACAADPTAADDGGDILDGKGGNDVINGGSESDIDTIMAG